MRKAEVAIIGGSGLESLFGSAEQVRVGTPYGLAPPISIGEIEGETVAFLPRHGLHHAVPPHMVNYRAIVYALHELDVEQIVATNAVGAINPKLKAGDFVVPHDFIDFTKLRRVTFYDEKPVTHIDFSQPYCPDIRSVLIRAAKKHHIRVAVRAVLVCTEGPRYETPAEIKMFRGLGCDVVGMTGSPEATLARELEMCYASICFVTNMAAGFQKRLTAREVSSVAKKKVPVLRQILRETIKHLPENRRCSCARTLKEARFQG